MSDIILCDLSDANSLISETKQEWLDAVLSDIGVGQDIIELAQTNIREFRFQMEGLGIEVDISVSGEINVYKKKWHTGASEEASGWLPITKECLVAQWKEPKRIRRIEGNKVYYEIHLDNWSFGKSRF